MGYYNPTKMKYMEFLRESFNEKMGHFTPNLVQNSPIWYPDITAGIIFQKYFYNDRVP